MLRVVLKVGLGLWGLVQGRILGLVEVVYRVASRLVEGGFGAGAR